MEKVEDLPLRIGLPGGAGLTGVLSTVAEPRLLVSINGATGVPAGFYRPFARWLAAEKEAAVLTWDYRDFGASGSPRGSKARMSDWVSADPVAARAALRGQFPGLPLWVIGHSLGGMAVGFQDDIGAVERVITVASGHGHLRDHKGAFRLKAWALWYLLGPVSATALDHFPSSRFGLGQDLPNGVFWQWRKWLLSPGALPADADLGGLRQPGITGTLTTIALADDDILPPHTVQKMAAWHPNAQIDYRLIRPSDAGLERIGHIHAFSPRNAAVWPLLIA